MALERCKECGHEVSTKAVRCPNCGAPSQQRKKYLWIAIVLGVLMFIGLIGNLVEDQSKNTSGTSSTQEANSSNRTDSKKDVVYNSSWDGSVSQVEKYLKRNLKDPKSLEIIEWSPVQKVDLPTHKYFVRCKYRAKNSFGGYVVQNQLFYLDKNGNVVNVKKFLLK